MAWRAWASSPEAAATASSSSVDVGLEPDRGDRARLAGAEQLAAAADLEVLRRDVEAGAELGEALQGLEPAAGVVGELGRRRHQQVAVGALLRPADAAAQLVELGQAEGVGAGDEHRVGPRDVEAALDDRGRDQDVALAVDEVDHDPLEPGLGQLAVGDRDPGLGDEVGEVVGPLAERAVVGRRRARVALAGAGCAPMCRAIQKTWPPRPSSRRIASRTTPSSSRATKVRTARRSAGGVAMIDRSRRPVIARCRVRGIGVAVRVGRRPGSGPA